MIVVPKRPKPSQQKFPRPPKYLRPETRRWWRSVAEDYELEEHHLKLLTLAAGAWDRAEQSREILAEQGLTFTDSKLNRLTAHPAVAIERDSRLAFARLLRELDLDTEPTPTGPRPPALKSNRR
jgi:phage terminase small subunit